MAMAWIALAALAAIVALPGCGASDEPRFNCLPAPISTVDLAASAASESAAITDDEWASLESLHDRYLADFDRLRLEVMVPLVREAQAAKDVQRDAAALARLSRRHSTALSRIRALDDRFTADLAETFRNREAFAQRVADRRSIARSARIVEGVANGSDRTPTLLDLEPLLRELRLGPQERAVVEPALATYRADLARAAQQLASAIIDKPADQLAAWTAAGVGDERLEELRRRSSEGEEARQAIERATADRRAADLQAGRPMARGYAAVDDANRRGLVALCAALPPEAAERLKSADERRRVSMDPALEGLRFGIDALALHPDVRSGKAARTARAIDSVRGALAALTRERIEQARARIASAELGEEAKEQETTAAREKQCGERLLQLAGELEAATKEEIRDGTLELLKSAATLHPDEMRERLAPVLGAVNADRLVSRTARNIFRSERENVEPAWNADLSIAEQLLLAPGMDHAAFHRAARAIGARDDDPLVEQIWDRHQSRAQALETRQREQMRALESIIVESTRRQKEDPAAFERKLGEYLQSLLNADNERRNADDETFREIAIAIDVPDTDARFALARAVAAARRAALPWRRFRQPWLLGAMWQSDFDPVSEALGIEDDVSRTAALVVLAAHADRLRESAEDARRTALEGMRDFLLFGLKMQAQGRSGSPEEFRNDTEVRGIVTRIEQAARGRREAQRNAIAGLASIDPLLGERFDALRAHATFPEFFEDGRAWRMGSQLVAAGTPEAASDAGAAIMASAFERWKIVDKDVVRLLAEWQDSPHTDPAPGSVAELVALAASEPVLGSLCTLRDENAWRLLRIAACAAGQSPDARLRQDERAGALPRPATWSP